MSGPVKCVGVGRGAGSGELMNQGTGSCINGCNDIRTTKREIIAVAKRGTSHCFHYTVEPKPPPHCCHGLVTGLSV